MLSKNYLATYLLYLISSCNYFMNKLFLSQYLTTYYCFSNDGIGIYIYDKLFFDKCSNPPPSNFYYNKYILLTK